MSGVRKRTRTLRVPEGWWENLERFCHAAWAADDDAPIADIYTFLNVSVRNVGISKTDNLMTPRTFKTMAAALVVTPEELLAIMRGERRAIAPKPPTTFASGFTLVTQRSNPQLADFRAHAVHEKLPWTLSCHVATDSRYFRFGFKLLGRTARLFGDGSIKSSDANLIVHIGRNYWDRESPRISARDIFVTAYAGVMQIGLDRALFAADRLFQADVSFGIDSNYVATLFINGRVHFHHVVPPEICGRVAVLAWGDQDEFRVEVTKLVLRGAGQ